MAGEMKLYQYVRDFCVSASGITGAPEPLAAARDVELGVHLTTYRVVVLHPHWRSLAVWQMDCPCQP